MLSNRQLFLAHLAPTSSTPLQLEVEKAEGVYLFSPEGKRYIDLISGISVSSLGHSHPRIVGAVAEQAAKHMHLMVYGEYVQAPQVRLAHSLSQVLPDTLQSVFLVNSGSEAVEGAIKLAKRATGRSGVVAFQNAYHGSTQGALSLMGAHGPQRAFRPLLPGIRRLAFNNSEQLQAIGPHTACVIVEPIQGEAGVVLPSPGFLAALRARCTQTGALLVFDEVQTGMGRTGRLFAFERYGVIPDVLVLAKALGGGMPLGAFIASRELMGTLAVRPMLGHITTFGGHPVSCAAALEALAVLREEKLHEQANAKAALIRQHLLGHPAVQGCRSAGLLMAFQLQSAQQVRRCVELALQGGVVLDWFLFCDQAFRVAPPLTITPMEIEQACAIILDALDRI